MAKKSTPKGKKSTKPTGRPRGKGLPIKPAADVTKLANLRQLGEPRGLRDIGSVRTPVEPLPSLLPDGLTEEQRVLRECGTQAKKLLNNDERLDAVIKSMVTFRRGYAIAYRELQEIVAQAREKDNIHLALEDFFIQYAMFEASKPFNEHQFMQGMIQVTIPSMADIIDRHTAEEQKERAQDRLEADEYRRQRSVPLGFKHSPQQEDLDLTKDRALVLTGWSNALLWLADQVMNTLLTAKAEPTADVPRLPYTVVRFMLHAPKAKDQHRYLIRIGGSAWKHCADTQKKLARCMGEYVADKLSAQPDLLIVDDLAETYGQGFVGRPRPASAGDAQRIFKRWCEQAGCGLLGLMPMDDKEAPDITAPEWEQLRTFTHLRPVRVIDKADNLDPAKYRLVIGNSAAFFEVEKTTLDTYGHGNIVVAGGVVNT